MADVAQGVFRLGAVVERNEDRERCQVLWIDGQGAGGHARLLSSDRYVLLKTAGVYVVGNRPDEWLAREWRVVPREEWTAQERIRCALLRYQRPDWLEEGEEPNDCDTLEWALLTAIAGENVLYDEDGTWPSLYDLWIEFGRWLDETTAAVAQADGAFRWNERSWLNRPGPNGKTWVTREMVGYSSDLSRFIPHLQAMAEGLERPFFSNWGDTDNNDDGGVFVVGLRDTTADDQASAKAAAERQEADERRQLAELLEKYGPPSDEKGEQGA